MYDNNYDYNNQNPIDIEPAQPKKNNKVGKAVASVIAIALIGGASGYGGAYLSNSLNDNSKNVTTTQESEDDTSDVNVTIASTPASSVTPSKTDDGLSIQGIVQKVTPSTVMITSKFSNGTGTGTGIIMSQDGYIITNAHVIQNEVTTYNGPSDGGFSFWTFGSGSYKKELEQSKDITVTLSDSKDYKATVIGSDTNSDLAVLKIDATSLTPAEFGDSSNLQMGDTTVAIGYPAGLGLSTTQGIVSGLNREVTFETQSGSTTTMTLIQTDAAINPGNSGGPLVNKYGQVIGINSSKLVDENLEGLGFAIPITDAQPLINELLNKGYVTDKTPKIGITGTDVTSAAVRYYNLPVENGVMIVSVESGSCAEKAGIAAGDIIIAADDKTVESMNDLVKIKNSHKAGDTMTVTLARKDGNQTVELILDSNSDTQ